MVATMFIFKLDFSHDTTVNRVTGTQSKTVCSEPAAFSVVGDHDQDGPHSLFVLESWTMI